MLTSLGSPIVSYSQKIGAQCSGEKHVSKAGKEGRKRDGERNAIEGDETLQNFFT
jgi:hypothetical protein